MEGLRDYLHGSCDMAVDERYIAIISKGLCVDFRKQE